LKPAVVGTPVSAADWNAFITDLQTALTDTLRASVQAFVGQVLFDPLGDAATPAISFTGDMDTGIFQASANEIGISTNGTERVLVKDAGVDVAGVLAVTGNETVSGTLNVVGNTDIDANLNVDGNVVIDGTSLHTGVATFTATPVLTDGINGIRTQDLPTSVYAISASSGSDAGTTGTADVAALSVTITSEGRPVLLSILSAGTTTGGISLINTNAGNVLGDLTISRSVHDAAAWVPVAYAEYKFTAIGATDFECIVPPGFSAYDVPGGTPAAPIEYDYKVTEHIASGTIQTLDCRLLVQAL
jgi:hypothetical protein